MELISRTIAGNVAATLEWFDDAPLTGLAPAVIAVGRGSGFTALKEPLTVSNLRLLKNGGAPVGWLFAGAAGA